QHAFPLDAPAASKALTMLDEVDGPLVFVSPPAARHPALAFIDLHERTRRENRIHGPIVQTDESITLRLRIERAEHGGRKTSPALNLPAEIGRAPQIEAYIQLR